MSELKDKTAKGLLWGGLSNGVTQILGAVFGIILLNYLERADYGLIASLLIFSGIASNLQESGFISALVNKGEPTHHEYNAVFWLNILVSICVYVVLWFASPLIAQFYHEPVITPLARFLFLGFVISSFGTVQRAYLLGHLMVKQQSIISVTALVVSNIIGITMAMNHFAFWGLATQSVTYVLIVTLLDWYVSPWRPTLHFDLKPAWQMFGFSSKILITNMFNQLNSHVFSVLLAYYYKMDVVGDYSNARKWDDMASNTISGMVNSVAQPVLAQVRDEAERYRQVFRKMLRFISFVSFPCMLGLGLIAHEFIVLAAGQRWENSALLLTMLCVHGAFCPITLLYSNFAISRGKSDINMFCTISLCILVWIGLIIMHPYGIYAMITFFVAINILWLLVWQWFAWRLVQLRLIDVLKDILPFFLLAAGVMVATYFATIWISNLILLLISKIIIAVILYCGLTWLSGAKIMRESINYILKKG